jgi:hypothetical protein
LALFHFDRDCGKDFFICSGMQLKAMTKTTDANGPQIEIFRGVSEDSLRSFAAQGDSAAMAVLGARAAMRALELHEQRAVPWLQFEDVNMETMLPGKTFSEPALFELDEAAQWFYRAAMHGRLYALRNYEVIAARHGGPVGLGWIEDEDFRSLSSRERSALYPSNVHQNVAKWDRAATDGRRARRVWLTGHRLGSGRWPRSKYWTCTGTIRSTRFM